MSIEAWISLISILMFTVWTATLSYQNNLLKKQNELLKDLSSEVTDSYNSLASQNEMLRRNHDKLIKALKKLGADSYQQ